MATGNLLGIGITGLNAAQAGLTVTGHNISNVNTPGYSRQQVVQTTAQPMWSGAGYIGQGASVETVRRVYSGFLTAQTQNTTASAAQTDTLRAQLQQLDGVLGDPAVGLASALTDFFGGVNGVAANPGDIAARTVMLSDAQALASRFHQLASSIAEQTGNANGQIADAVGTINSYAGQIAELNRRIGELTGASGDLQPPNDLLDQRDALVTKLNEQVGVASVAQSDGSFNVYLSSGDALVVGTVASALVAVPDNNDPRNVQIGLKTPAGTLRLASAAFVGGAVGGLLQFRDNSLAPAANTLGQLAAVLAGTFNDQHALGIDLGGAAGGAFFAAPVPQTQAALANAGNATLDVSLVPGGAGALTASDYRVTYDGTNYSVTRLADNVAVATGDLAVPPTIDVDGLRIALGSGAAAAGDSFLVQPTRYAAGQIGVAITDARKIAAASPIRTSVPSALSLAPPPNTGSATISAGSVGSAYLAAPPPLPATLTYSAASNQFAVAATTPAGTVTKQDGTSTSFAAGGPIPYQAGATISFGGISFVISGTPGNNDTFTIAPNANPVGDNRNAALLAALQGNKLVGGAATYGDAYSQLVGAVGASTSETQIEAKAQDSLLVRAQTAQQEVSGVNLDEEAANLMRYQQAYQASAKLMTVAASLFDSILAIGR